MGGLELRSATCKYSRVLHGKAWVCEIWLGWGDEGGGERVGAHEAHLAHHTTRADWFLPFMHHLIANVLPIPLKDL